MILIVDLPRIAFIAYAAVEEIDGVREGCVSLAWSSVGARAQHGCFVPEAFCSCPTSRVCAELRE